MQKCDDIRALNAEPMRFFLLLKINDQENICARIFYLLFL